MLKNNPNLLAQMARLQKESDELFKPGPYWANNTIVSFRELEKKGITNFRSYHNNSGQSFTDSPYVDIRPSYNIGTRRILYFLTTKVFLISRVLDSQVKITIDIFKAKSRLESNRLLNNTQVLQALENLIVPEDSTRGGCESTSEFKDYVYSNLYLEQLCYIDIISKFIKLNTVRNFMELGGGFGANLHILLTNYRNIKKVIYVDISPNLYVATEYLRSFYGNSVVDCSDINSRFAFNTNDDLEIFCILPSQLHYFIGTIDYFYNSHSFVEMPKLILENYARIIQDISNNSKLQIALVTYQTGGEVGQLTYNYEMLPNLFKTSFETLNSTFPSDGESAITYFISAKQ